MQLVNILWFGLLITPQAFALDTCAGKPFGYKLTNPENPHSYNLCFGFLGFQLPQSCDEGFRFSEEMQNCISEKQTSSKTNPTKGEPGSLTTHQNVSGNKPFFFNIFGYIWPWSGSTTHNAPESQFSTPSVDTAIDENKSASDLGSTGPNTDDDNLNLEELSSVDTTPENNNAPSSDSSTLIAEDAFIQLSQDISEGDYLSSGDGPIQDIPTDDRTSSSDTSTESNVSSSEEPLSSTEDLISTESSSSSTSEPILDSSPSNSEEPLPLESFIQLSDNIFAYDSDESSQDSSTESNVSSSEEPLSSTEDLISTESSSSSTSEPILDSSPSNSEEPLPLESFIQLSDSNFAYDSDESSQDTSTESNVSSSEEPLSSTEDLISTESSSSSTSEPNLDSSPSNSEEPLPLESFIQLSDNIFAYDSDESSQDTSTESNVSSSEEPLSSTEDLISTKSSSSSTSEPNLDSSPSNSEEPLPLDSFIQLSDSNFAYDSDESSQDTSTESNVSSSEEPSSSSTEQPSSSPEITEPLPENSSSPVKEVSRDIPLQLSKIPESAHDISSLDSLNNALMETISLNMSQKSPISKREDSPSSLITKLSPSKSNISKKPMGLQVLGGNEKLSICSFLPDGTFLRDLRSCNKFFVCTNGRILAGHCPNELYFDIDKRVCNFPSLVECKVDEDDVAHPLNKITLTKTSSIAKSEAGKEDTSSVKDMMPNKLLSKLLPSISSSKEAFVVTESNGKSFTKNNFDNEPLSSPTSSLVPESENSKEENISGTEETLFPSEPFEEDTSTEKSIPSSVPPEENSSTEESISSPISQSTPPSENDAGEDSESSSSAPESENSSTEESIPITEEPLAPTAPSVEDNSTDAPYPVETTTSDCTGLPNGAFIRDPQLCGKFYVCSNGKAIPQYCPGILHFDIKKKVCNFPSLVDCSNDNVQKVSSSLKSTEKLTGVPDCSSLPNGAYVRDDESCSKFYICANRVAIAKQCPRGLYFDITKGYCNMPSLVNCTIKKAEHQYSLASGIGIPNCSNKENGASSRDSKMCNKYYVCHNGKPTTHYCAPGKWFDIDLQICAHKLTVECNI